MTPKLEAHATTRSKFISVTTRTVWPRRVGLKRQNGAVQILSNSHSTIITNSFIFIIIYKLQPTVREETTEMRVVIEKVTLYSANFSKQFFKFTWLLSAFSALSFRTTSPWIFMSSWIFALASVIFQKSVKTGTGNVKGFLAEFSTYFITSTLMNRFSNKTARKTVCYHNVYQSLIIVSLHQIG